MVEEDREGPSLMPVQHDISDIPRRTSRGGDKDWPPDATPRFGSLLVEAWHAEAIERDADFPNAVEGARFRHSDAGACARAISLSALGVPASNPMDAPGHFITHQGSWLHDEFQKLLVAHYGGAARIEVKCGKGDRGGHVDAEVYLSEPDEVEAKIIAIEAKSMDGFAYKMSVGERGKAQGPKSDHIIQAALNGKAINADEIVILYLTRGAISIQAATRNPKITEMMRVTAEWTLTREEYEPIADLEIKRITGILGLLDQDEPELAARKIPDPEMPERHLVTDPATGTYHALNAEGLMVGVNTTWHCVYCRHQQLCSLTPSERTPIVVVDEAITRLGLPARPIQAPRPHPDEGDQ
jgi:hypothetical protein